MLLEERSWNLKPHVLRPVALKTAPKDLQVLFFKLLSNFVFQVVLVTVLCVLWGHLHFPSRKKHFPVSPSN